MSDSASALWWRRLEADHARTLANLVSGLTDGASAHRLGVSERTVQRRIRELMDWSGSGNRMQLGRHAALAGPGELVPLARAQVPVPVPVPVPVRAPARASARAPASPAGPVPARVPASAAAPVLAQVPVAVMMPLPAAAYVPEAVAEPVPVPVPIPMSARGVRRPGAEDLRLLRLLLADAAADRMLGLSGRSVERRVREVMALAGARSRAQLGWLATLRGWI